MYKAVNQGTIKRLLTEMGMRLRFPCRLYLVGGTTLVYEGLRAQSKDVDFGFEIENKHDTAFATCIQALKRELDISIELVTPKDFIPLPSGWRDRCRYIARFGQMEVFHYDPVSTALSKIERGRLQDMDDIRVLLREGWMTMDDLKDGYENILPRFMSESLKRDPDRFASRFNAFLEYVQSFDSGE